MPSGFRPYALVLYVKFQGRSASLSPEIQRVFPVYNNPKFIQAGKEHSSSRERTSSIYVCGKFLPTIGKEYIPQHLKSWTELELLGVGEGCSRKLSCLTSCQRLDSNLGKSALQKPFLGK